MIFSVLYKWGTRNRLRYTSRPTT